MQNDNRRVHQDQKRCISKNHASKPPDHIIRFQRYIYKEFVPQGQSIASTTLRYWNICWREWSVRPDLQHSGWRLLHNNVPAHTPINVSAFVAKKWGCCTKSPSVYTQPGSTRPFFCFPVWNWDWTVADLVRSMTFRRMWRQTWIPSQKPSLQSFQSYMNSVLSVFGPSGTILGETVIKSVLRCFTLFVLLIFCCTV